MEVSQSERCFRRPIYRFLLISLSVLFINFFFTSCHTLTIAEFKSRYDWDECIAVVKDYGHNDIFVEFEAEGRRYIEPVFDYPNGVKVGYKYKILINKHNPGKDFIVLFHEQVRPTPISITEVSAIILKVDICTNYLLVKYEATLQFQVGGKTKLINTEAFPLLEKDKCLDYANKKSCVIVEMYMLSFNSEKNLAVYQPFLSINKLCSEKVYR